MKNIIRRAERGSALFLILIAVALFAALGYAVSNMMQGGSSTNIGDEQSRLYATEILDYARTMRQTIQAMRIDGCRDTEISFENPFFVLYVNANAPLDQSCHMFEPKGAGLSHQFVNEVSLFSATTFSSNYVEMGITDVGSNDNSELLYRTALLKNKVCTAINDIIGIENPGGFPPIDTFNGFYTFFDGDYTPLNTDISRSFDTPQTNGKMAGCVSGFFYQVLIAR